MVLVGAMLSVRLVCVVSYPFFIEGDGETYYQLLLESQAHLLHATGYIFFSLPLRLLAQLVGTEPANVLLFFQQAFSAAAVATTNGIATQKYIILSESLPKSAAGPWPWKKKHQVPETVRAPFRQKWSALLETQNASYVTAAFEALSPSEPRRTSYDDPAAFSSIYYYLGLPDGEKLLGDVYWEGVRGHTRQYVANVCSELVHSANFSTHSEPYLPVPGVYEPGDFFKLPGMPFTAAPPRVFKAVDWSVAKPEDLAALAAQVWHPGARLFSFLAFMKYIPSSFLWIVMLSGFFVGPIFLARYRRLRPAETLLILTAVALLGEMGFSALLFVFRNKELILCQPLIYLMMGLSISLWVELVSTRRAPEQGELMSRA